MADFPVYQNIPNSDIDPESPITTSLMTLLRDNPIAMMAYWIFTASDTLTIPHTGLYQVISLGGGQGGDGGEDGSGAGWSSCTIVTKQVTKDGSDANTGGVGGTSSVYLGATNIITTPGGGNTGDVETCYGTEAIFSMLGQGSGGCAQATNPGDGGNGGSSFLGVGGDGGTTSVDGSAGGGYGAGGGGGWVQDGNQLGSFGNGGMSGMWGDVLYNFTANDVLTITVGAAGAAQSGSRGNGGAGSAGIVMVKWWPDTASLGL